MNFEKKQRRFLNLRSYFLENERRFTVSSDKKDSRLNVRCSNKTLIQIAEIQKILQDNGEEKTTSEAVVYAIEQLYMRLKDNQAGGAYSEYMYKAFERINKGMLDTMTTLEAKNYTLIARILYEIYLSNVFMVSCFKLPDDLNRVFRNGKVHEIIRQKADETFMEFVEKMKAKAEGEE